MAKEKRIAVRRELQWSGAIVDVEGAPRCRCRVANVSSTGAKLAVETPDQVPDRFVLLLSQNGSVRRICDVKWRSKNAIGVGFGLSPAAEQAAISRIYDTMVRLAPVVSDQE